MGGPFRPEQSGAPYALHPSLGVCVSTKNAASEDPALSWPTFHVKRHVRRAGARGLAQPPPPRGCGSRHRRKAATVSPDGDDLGYEPSGVRLFTAAVGGVLAPRPPDRRSCRTGPGRPCAEPALIGLHTERVRSGFTSNGPTRPLRRMPHSDLTRRQTFHVKQARTRRSGGRRTPGRGLPPWRPGQRRTSPSFPAPRRPRAPAPGRLAAG